MMPRSGMHSAVARHLGARAFGILAVFLVPGLPSSTSGAEKPPGPNIVLVMTDDQGWGDTAYNGHPELKTPNLNEMADNGLRLNRFYAAHFNCSPTRGSVLTGRHPNRYGTFNPGAPIRPQEITIAQVAKSAGYATGHFGKWHLNGVKGAGKPIAADDPLSPGRLGFDEWVSVSNYFDLDPLMARNGVEEQFRGDSSDVTTDEALKFIRRQAAHRRRFLAVVWFGSPHVPHRALEQDKTAYAGLSEKEQNYYGELTAVDRSIGRLRAELRALKVADDTIVWFCSDNGGAFGEKSTGALRGSKGTLWEGGLRVPGLIEWPARIPVARASEVPCSTLDIYPTLLEAMGATAPKQVKPLDGISVLQLVDGKMNARGRPIPFWARAGKQKGHAALLEWPYKLHRHAVSGRAKRRAAGEDVAATLLYDVSKDPNETIDLAAKEPDLVSRMTETLEKWQASVEKSLAGGDYTAGVRTEFEAGASAAVSPQ